MTGNAKAVKKQVKEWLQNAEEDLRLARHAFKLRSAVPHKLIAYHAQQCAEKCLKAYLVYKEIDFPFTHNISLLIELLPPSAEWSNSLWTASILSSYAVTARYPGKGRVTKREAIRAVSVAETVRRTIVKALLQEGLKIPPRTRS